MDGETVAAVRLMKQEQAARVRADLRRDERRAVCSPAGRRIGRTGQHALSVGQAAFFNARQSEGPEIATSAGDGYWRDMVRRYPHLRGGGVYDGSAVSGNGRNTRFGKVTQMFRDGRWWRVLADGALEPMRSPRRKWG